MLLKDGLYFLGKMNLTLSPLMFQARLITNIPDLWNPWSPWCPSCCSYMHLRTILPAIMSGTRTCSRRTGGRSVFLYPCFSLPISLCRSSDVFLWCIFPSGHCVAFVSAQFLVKISTNWGCWSAHPTTSRIKNSWPWSRRLLRNIE